MVPPSVRPSVQSAPIYCLIATDTKLSPQVRDHDISSDRVNRYMNLFNQIWGQECHCKQMGFINGWFGNCQNCHCKRGVTVTSVTVSGEVCTIFFLYGLPGTRSDSHARTIQGQDLALTYYRESHKLLNGRHKFVFCNGWCYSLFSTYL